MHQRARERVLRNQRPDGRSRQQYVQAADEFFEKHEPSEITGYSRLQGQAATDTDEKFSRPAAEAANVTGQQAAEVHHEAAADTDEQIPDRPQ